VSSFTFTGLSSSWPKEGTKLGDGWTCGAGALDNVAFTVVPELKIGSPFDASTVPVALAQGSKVYPIVVTDGEYHSGDTAGFNINVEQVVVPIGYGRPVLVATYDADRQMGHNVSFTMKTDVQDVLTLAPESDSLIVTVNSNPVSDITFDGSIPIGDVRKRDFIRTDRGQLAIKHLMLIARANLVNGTRVAQTSFNPLDFETAIQITLRKGALYHDRRFPGGQVIGKVASYTFALDGDSGDLQSAVTILSTVGKGGSYVEAEGDGVYALPGYMARHYQQEINTVTTTGVTDDLAFTMPEFVVFDDGVDFRSLSASKVVTNFIWANTAATQLTYLDGLDGADQGTVSATLQLVPTQCSLQLIPMSGGPFAETVIPVVADLLIPKQIDLEAESND
jgi:hypothetical protein